MVLIATVQQLQLLCDRAEATYPEECCGLLLGTISGEIKTVREVVPTENSWDGDAAAAFGEALGLSARATGKERSFAIAPQILLQVQKQARDRHLNIIGIYHSHPDAPAIPSQFDRAIAWPQYSYPIISVLAGKAENLFSWTLDNEGNFQAEAIHINVVLER
ncbi:M67 family metallopeptidase [Oscillatoria sp. FACHB-1406]|uniref:M67 family metallopeptidase n=1 Tax=Oscillatoria sp. FACHB-1406 TaxID=2692846 RepID=UPI0016852865|nr:M67 family metallopeptidase [Oscillatoria sp. FACHB-1406]MBD2576442.1 M67 family metallopeptidase [Oscillatoria sp. FACHB-1406]